MNWTATLLRNELTKQKSAYEARINLLTQTSIDAQNFLELEEEIALLTTEIATYKQNISQLTNECKEQKQSLTQEIKVKENSLAKLEKKDKVSKELISNLQKQIRELNLYHQREIKKVKENYESKLTPFRQEISGLKEKLEQEKLALISIAKKKLENKKEFQQLLTDLQTQQTSEKEQLKQEITTRSKELEFVTSKITSCEKIFVQQIIKIIKKNIILWKSKELKSALTQIKELMDWENLTLPTETATATPAEPTE
ncbi:MAG: Chromosome partition protein Smc [Mycoplasmataceae bacterium]|nr:MAG: Chromosome partition protein Smc [Mycoplasmataceae bacterium]